MDSGSPGTGGAVGAGGAAPTKDAAASGCANGEPVCLDTPADGFVIEDKGTIIKAGDDLQYCEVVTLPGTDSDTYFVQRIDGRMTPYSHHLNVMALDPGGEADKNTTPGQLVQCANNGRSPFGAGMHQIYGAASPEASESLPEGVGYRLQGGQKLVFNYHYFNTSEDDVPARAVLAFHVTDASHVKREMRRFGMYNTGFSIPAGKSAAFTSECKMAEDVRVIYLSRHTHRWGTDFNVWRAGGADDGTPVFTSHDYEEDILFQPEDTFIVKQGEGLRFECQFENTTDHTLAFGELVNDEMCILYGGYVSTVDGAQAKPEDCVILNSSEGQVAEGVPCAQCPDGQ